MDWNNPQTYNEKLQWLKLYNRKPEYSILVDKVRVKEWVESIIGKEYIIPNLGVWESVEDIEFQKLPNRFVLKCNHNSGLGMYICNDKKKMNIDEVKKDLKRGLAENYVLQNREWPYKNVPRKILAEEYLEDPVSSSLNDYKVMCFGGKVKLIEVHMGRNTDHHTQDFYDENWEKTSITQGQYGATSDIVLEKPSLFTKMKELSEKLSAGIPHVRVDWYIVNNRLYFGEMTFFDGSGFVPFDRFEDDLLLGSWIDCP